MRIALFEDHRVTQLYPATIGKPAYAISCGSYRLLDLVRGLGDSVLAWVRPHLSEFREAEPPPSLSPGGKASPGQTAYVNARLVPSAEIIEALRKLFASGREGFLAASEEFRPEADRGQPPSLADVACAVLPAGAPPPPPSAGPEELSRWWSALKLAAFDGPKLPLFDYPHDIIRHHLKILAKNLEHRLAAGDHREAAEGVFLAEGALLGQHVVTDTRNGPIVIDERASIGPHGFLSGPVHIGAGARVIEQAAIKDGVALGHTTKVGGEVEGSIIEPYTNKQHHGFLGHSYLGSWINLGAGTCNSDLKNTYGPVNMEYHGRKTPTGMQFVGCIAGDYAKSAINTGIFTGKTIGACSMIYGFVTTNVPSFTNYARLFGQVTEAPVEIMVATQARMFARRNVEQRPCDVQLLHDMYELTRHERQIAGEPLSL
ncbi:MAG TPA: putative sugar nucleotidyl transferase [Pirellulales bacterium]|nr:putative sugar nucleotidyl transferase [Pirellulales bacterium]